MAYRPCTMCSGSGKINCSICGGRGFTSRLTVNLEAETTPCLPKMTCSMCGGSGRINMPDGPLPPHTRASPPPEAKPPAGIAGKWQADDGSVYEVDGAGSKYTMLVRSPIGDARGPVRLNGRRGRLTLDLPMLGPVEASIEVAEDWRTMTITTHGVPARFVRTWWPGM